MNPSIDLPIAPLRYDPSCERLEDDEAETGREMTETLRKISEIVRRDTGHAYRSVHAKGHGIVFGRLDVLPGLPLPLAQGAFATPGPFPVVMRFSTSPGDLLDDSISTPRGLAVKIVGVEGERLPGTEGDVTQDFLMINGPVFAAPNPRQFLKTLKLLAGTTDKAPGAKKVLAAALRGIESLIEKAGGESGTLKALGGHPETNLLGETFYTQVPMRYGEFIAKLSIAPVSPELTALTHAPIDAGGHPDALREAVLKHFSRQGGVWEVRVQLCTNPETMPIEDASVEWPEAESPYLAVARITAEPQVTWSDARVAAVDDGMSFSAWHSLAAHRPLGGIMRVRRSAYEMAARFRSEHNPVKVVEPKALESLPS